MSRGGVAALAVVAACGRVHFDPRGEDGGANGDAMPRANIAFVTSTMHEPGMLGGLAGADAICSMRAMDGGLTGTFVAFLSTTTVDAQDRVAGARGWVRVDGRMVADQIADLVSGNLVYPIGLDEHGNDIAAGPLPVNAYVTTGTLAGKLGTANCNDFANPATITDAGGLDMTHSAWTSRTTSSCMTALPFYCLQTDFNVALTRPAPSTGRLAFVSTGTFTTSTGIATADQLCADDATSAGKPGTFLALLPNGAAPASRFDTTKGPWVRADGLPVADTGDALMTGFSRAPIDLTVAGVRVESNVTTGSDAPDRFITGRDCAGWTSTAAMTNIGLSYSAGGSSYNWSTGFCTGVNPVYCLEL